MPTLVPIDHNPFGIGLIPVDHDPFVSIAPQDNPVGQYAGMARSIGSALIEPFAEPGRQIGDWISQQSSATPPPFGALAAPVATIAMGVAAPEFEGAGALAKGAESLIAARQLEKYNSPITTAYGKTIDMPVIVNPSKKHIQQMLAGSPYGDVRALRDPSSGDVYLWPANEAMHVDIADNFGLPFKTRQQLQSNSYLFNKRDVDAVGDYSGFAELIKRLGS